MDLIINGLYDHFKNNSWDLIKNILFVILIPFANIKMSKSLGKLLSKDGDIDLGWPVIILVITIIAVQILQSMNNVNNIRQSGLVANKFNERAIKNTLYRELPKNNAEIKVANDMFNINQLWSFNSKFFVSLKDDLIQFVVFYIFAIYTYFNIDKKIGYALLGFAVLTYILIKRSINKCKESGSKRDEQVAKFRSATDDVLANVKFIKLNNKEEESYDKLIESARKVPKYKFENVHCRTKYTNYLNILFIFFVVFIIYLIKKEKKANKIEKGDIVVIFFILSTLIGYRNRLSNFQSLLAENSGTVERLKWALEDHETKQQVKDIIKFEKIDNLEFDKVKLSKKQRTPIEFKATLGEIVCVVGDNGSGLYNMTGLLTGTNKPYSGRILINGQEYKPEQIFEISGILLQDPDLFNKTIKENLFLNSKIDEKNLEAKLKEANLLINYKNLLKKNKGKIGKRGSKLPMASRRLIELMRIVVKDPDFIILDNPFEFFDTDMQEKIKNLIIRWKNKNKIVFLLERNFYNFTSCDYVVNISRYSI
uniref:ABC transporter domain-containing protein n=1 Tax=viral metagenome TaxID=1070528 RepID=A0A6C0ACN7_9ZZZZ